MKTGAKCKALVLLTLFVAVFLSSLACQLFLSKPIPYKENVSILKSLEEDEHHWVTRLNDAEKENLSLRIIEFFNDSFAQSFHTCVEHLRAACSSQDIKLCQADTKLFLNYRQILI